ncbi:unnamed protein product [Boreogadus saida]
MKSRKFLRPERVVIHGHMDTTVRIRNEATVLPVDLEEPVGQQELEPVGQQELEPVGQQELEPVGQQELEPVGQHEVLVRPSRS